MKKYVAVFLLCVCLFSAVACGNPSETSEDEHSEIMITEYEENYGINDERNYYYSLELPAQVSGLKMPDIFRDNMMFQQNRPIRVWGLAPAGAKVEVRLYDQATGKNLEAIGVISAEDHSFVCELPARAASFTEYRLKVTCGSTERSYSDILIGEVFLASGQSNMQVVVGETYEGASLLSAADNEMIRVYNPAILPNQGDDTYSYRMQFETPKGTSAWIKGDDPSTYGLYSVSAVAYSCALQLFEELNQNAQVPVGFLNLPVGGTSIRAWLPRYAAEDDPELKMLLGSAYLPYREEETLHYGDFTALFNSKIAPVINFNIGGMIWYQGETDEGAVDMYRLAIEKLIQSYGKEFRFENGEIPFVMCHIAPFNTGAYENITTKTVQFNVVFDETERRSPQTRAVVALYDTDLRYQMGDLATIHPRVKETVGRRCGKALCSLLGRGAEGYDSPSLLSASAEGGNLYLRFDDCGEGLTCEGELKGFAVAGADKKFYAARAEIVSQDTVRLSCEYVPEPQYCSYAYSSLNMKANLKNRQGFAVRPFCNADGVPADSYYCQHDWLDCDDLTAWRYLPGVRGEDGSMIYEAGEMDLFRTDGADLALDGDSSLSGSCLRAETTRTESSISAILNYPYDIHQFNRFTSFSVCCKSDAVSLLRVEIEGDETAVLTLIDTEEEENGYTRYNFSLNKVLIQDLLREGYDYPAVLTELRLVFSGTGVIYIDAMSLGNL